MTRYAKIELVEKKIPIGGSGKSSIEDRYAFYKARSIGNTLVGFYDRLLFKIVADVSSFEDFKMFEEQYKQGYIVSRDFYAVTEEEFERFSQ